SELDPCPQHFQKCRQPRRMSGPGRARDEIAIHISLLHRYVHILAAGRSYVGGAGGITVQTLALYDTCRGQDLCAVAESGDWFVGLGEVLHDFEHPWVQADVLWCTASRDQQRVIVLRLNSVEVGIEREIVSALFAVGLVPFKIVDRGAYGLTALLARTD